MSILPLVSLWLADPAVVADPSDPLPIVGGTDAGACQFPTVVAMLTGGGSATICSGTLIHPQVVMTAAHCLIPEAPIDAVAFGEQAPDAGTPIGLGQVAYCTAHPDYATLGAHDVAFCVLETPVSLQITPVLDGCEAAALVPGQEVVIVGFGTTFAVVDDQGEIVEAQGVGTKRYTTQTIHSLDDVIGVVNLASPNGSQSACFGDSGGPAFVRLQDGSWRVFGTGSTLFDPGGLPPPVLPGNACGVGAAYGNASTVIDWIEGALGFDVTPCHDAGGVFTGGAACGGFPQEIHHAQGEWNDGCVGGALAGGIEVCAPWAGPFDPDPTGGDTTGEPPDPTEGDTTGEPPPPPDPTGVTTVDPSGEVPPPEPEPEPLPPDEGTAGSSSSDGADQQGGLADRGCGCTSTPAAGAPWLLLLAAVRRRRVSRR